MNIFKNISIALLLSAGCNTSPATHPPGEVNAVARARHHHSVAPDALLLRLIHDRDLDPAQERALVAIRSSSVEQRGKGIDIGSIAHSVADQVLALQATFSPEQRAQLREHYAAAPARADLIADARAAFESGAIEPDLTAVDADRVGKSPLHHRRALADAVDRVTEPLLHELEQASPDRAKVHALVAEVVAASR